MLSFHVKFVQTDRWMDRQTTVKQYAYDLSIQEKASCVCEIPISPKTATF